MAAAVQLVMRVASVAANRRVATGAVTAAIGVVEAAGVGIETRRCGALGSDVRNVSVFGWSWDRCCDGLIRHADLIGI